MNDKLQKTKELFDSGLGARKIAQALGVTRWAVQQMYKELGIYDIGRTNPRKAHLKTEQKCKICETVKTIDQFRKRDRKGRASFEVYCIPCEQEYSRKACSERYDPEKAKQYRAENLEELQAKSRKYNAENKDKILQHRLENKEKYREYQRKYFTEKRASNPEFKIRGLLSNSVLKWLKRNDSNKNGKSILQNLPYTMAELRTHLEFQFESWMNWENHGKYRKTVWDDNNQSTWTWQIDHIIPCSDLPYASMEDENFRTCWALANLRPLSAKQNIEDGTRRIRHQNK